MKQPGLSRQLTCCLLGREAEEVAHGGGLYIWTWTQKFKTAGHESRYLDPGVGGALAPDGGRETICTWDAEKYLENRKDGLWRNLDSTPILTLYWHVDWGSNC